MPGSKTGPWLFLHGRKTMAAGKELKIVGDNVAAQRQKNLEFSLPEDSSNTFYWSVPDGATITSGQGTDSILVDWGTTEGLVTLVLENNCDTTNASYFQRFCGQYPYPDPDHPQQIPGTIIPTHYDFGGEGTAYHDNTLTNEGPGPRQDERVDTEYGDGLQNVGWITAGEWIEYTIRVDTTGRIILYETGIGGFDFFLDTANFSPGICILSVLNGSNDFLQRKFIKTR